MVSLADTFETQRWLALPVLERDVCAKLTARLHRLHEHGGTDRDTQCPKSDAIRDDAALDSVLEQLVPHLEAASGLTLSPTYCYARIYRPGEVLHRHTDRPACEVSITVTLGYSGDLWPIFVGGHELLLPVGDGAMYYGCEVEHWRDEYTQGEWQTQAFFHYVNALGPHRNWRYDRRSKLAHH